MTKQMPGFQDYKNSKEEKIKTELDKKTKENERQEFLKMQLKKFGTIFKHTSKKDLAFNDFLRTFFQVQTISFLIGSMAFLFSSRTQFVNDYGKTTGGMINNPLMIFMVTICLMVKP